LRSAKVVSGTTMKMKMTTAMAWSTAITQIWDRVMVCMSFAPGEVLG